MRSTSDRSRSRALPRAPTPPVSYAPRRTVLDKLLVDAASEAGAEVREGFTVEEVRGRRRPRHRHSRPWPRRVVGHRARARRRRGRRLALGARASGAPRAIQREAAASGRLLHLLERTPDERPLRGVRPPVLLLRRRGRRTTTARSSSRGGSTRSSRRTSPISKATITRLSTSRRASPSACEAPGARSGSWAWPVPNYFRKPFGPGWALVGDAGYNKDFITAQGIQDAFRDAELCADCAGRVVRRRALVRRGDGRLPVHARSARPGDVRVHGASWRRRSLRPPSCRSCSARCTATRRRWTGSRASAPG